MDQSIKETIEKDFKKFFNNIGRKKEYIGDVVTIKARGLKGCSLDNNYSLYKFNMIPDPEYGIIKTKFKNIYDIDGRISIPTKIDFDTLFIMLLNKGQGTIDNVYAIPKEELEGKRIIITTDIKNIYQKFKIGEKPYNDIYCHMRTGKYSILDDGDIIIRKI